LRNEFDDSTRLLGLGHKLVQIGGKYNFRGALVLDGSGRLPKLEALIFWLPWIWTWIRIDTFNDGETGFADK
jgi:hypothetical protein